MPGLQQFDLHDKVAVVTGGSKGLGYAMASGLASAGCNLVLVSRHYEQAQAAAAQIAEEGAVQCVACQADVCEPDDVTRMVDTTLEQFGKIDVLVNNAGINLRGPIDGLTYDEFRRVQQVNVDGMWLCSQAVVPTMKNAGSGRIINLASTLGLVGLQNRTPYASSKGAVVQMTRALALELAPWNILCNAICPGPFLTPMNEPIADSDEAKEFIIGAVALKRWGRMEEIQGAAIFLASDAASYMTGSMLVVDGGWTAR